jgi:SAM-dependent methyltransferase
MDFLESWRLAKVRPFVRGRLLDLACGYNNLVREHGNGVGVDVHPWDGVDVVVEDPARLPFADGEFDTASIVAALNHIPNRADTLHEVRRVLKPGGLLLVTMIGPMTGRLAHLLFHHDEAVRGGMRPGELDGIPPRAMRQLLSGADFERVREIPFQLGLNRLYVARKP